MRVIVTADLHYDVARSREPTRALAAEICRRGGDFLLIVGDSASASLTVLEEVFGLFESFGGPRLAVAGNHELWTLGGGDSLHKYENELRQACARCGVHYLDAAPFRLGDVGFAGSVGWYDYSFRAARMQVPLRFYQHKVGPGAASYFREHQHLLSRDADVPPAARDITSRWMDGQRVRLPMSDVEFTHRQAEKLRRHLGQLNGDCRKIVAAVHHLPFAELVPRSVIPNWEFANGFMGSELLGEAILECPQVSHVFCGHSHRPGRIRKAALECINVGSTYREKRYEVLDL